MLDTVFSPHRGRSRQEVSTTDATASSAPMQIPTSRRPAPSIDPMNLGFTMGPDAVFEMSPVTSEFGCSPSSFTQNDRRNSVKFLYNFPSLSRQSISDSSRTSSPYEKGSLSPPNSSEDGLDRNAEISLRYRVSEPLAAASGSPLSKGSSLILDEYDLSPGGMSPDPYSPIKENYRLRHQPSLRYQRNPRTKPSLGRLGRRSISPGPRQPLSETSPWLFPCRDNGGRDIIGGTKKNSQEDVASSCSYSQIDPSVFEFKKHLMQRLDSSRMNMRSCM